MILLLLFALPVTVTPAGANIYPSELPWTVYIDCSWFYGIPGEALVKPPDAGLFRADKGILVAPLGFENGRLRAFICAYKTDELPLPEETQILRVHARLMAGPIRVYYAV